MTMKKRSISFRAGNQPKVDFGVLMTMLFGVGFFLHFFWEMMQVPFYQNMADRPHFQVVLECARASLGDAGIMLVAYAASVLIIRRPFWLLQNRLLPSMTVFWVTGEVITIAIEGWATQAGAQWRYSKLMPTLPILGTGLLPVLQWLIVPFITLWVSRWSYIGWRFGQPEL